MNWKTVVFTVAFYCGAQPGMAQVTLADCTGIKDSALSDVEKVERLYDCVDALASRPSPGALTFRKPDHYGRNWSRYSTTPPPRGYRDFEFAKGADGMVHLRGLMTGCPSTEISAFTLPEGYRPMKGTRLVLTTLGAANNSLARVDVMDDGQVYFWYSADKRPCEPGKRTHWLTLDGLTFQGEQ